MSEQNKKLIKVEELVVKLNNFFASDFSVSTIKNLRDEEKIPAEDTRTPGTKMPRWKYNFEDVRDALINLSAKE